MAVSKMLGASVKRVEDPRLITGRGMYVDDVKPKGQLYLAFVRSPYAHARILSIDVGDALKGRLVRYVMTGEEAAANLPPIPCVLRSSRLKRPIKYPLAHKKTIFVGEPVVAIVAEDQYACYDAVEKVKIEYEPLKPILDPEDAIREGASLIHEELGTNIAIRSSITNGDVEAAFNGADVVVRTKLINQRVAATALEPRCVLANYSHRDGVLEVWSSTQIPHFLKTHIAKALRYPENKVRVVAPDVGGGFGSKLNIYAEELVAAYLSQRLRRPIKWVESRRENFLATTHGRGQIHHIELAVRRDGRILGLKARLIADIGAYNQMYTPSGVLLTASMLPGPYKIENVSIEAMSVFTNKMPVDAYRGAGRPEATYAIERVIDMAAHKLGMDPAEIRFRNFIEPHEFPYETSTGMRYDSGNYAEALRMAMNSINYLELRERRGNGSKRIGIGIGFAVEVCGFGPSRETGAEMGGWESATLRIHPSGKVSLVTGLCPTGQGSETTLAQIVAEKLGVPMEDVSVVYGDTANVAYGIGTFGSRSASVGGSAVSVACDRIVEKAKTIAAALLETSPGDLEYEGGRFYVRGSPHSAVSLQQVAAEAYAPRKIPTDVVEPGLEVTVFYDPTGLSYPYAAHVAVVEVDTETGQVRLLKYVSVDDCGRVINPTIVEGQIHGGIAQGLGQALLEELVYSEDGQLLTQSFSEYLIPSASDIPSMENSRTETPGLNPLGVKGVGELATLASTAAIVNAVSDALKDLGVEITEMPLKPEYIWRLVKSVDGLRPI